MELRCSTRHDLESRTLRASDSLFMPETMIVTDIIAYVVTDQSGLTATSTTTVIIEPAATPPSDSTATTTEATTTAQ
jgi:hypothetical protein